MSKHILLINPWIIDFKAYDLWMKPLGLLHISSILRKKGFSITLLDCLDRNHPSVVKEKKLDPQMTGKFVDEEIEKPLPYKQIPRKYKRYGIPIEAFKKELKKISAPDFILVTSVMTYWYQGVHLAISILKEKFPGVPLILGGIYPTLCPEFAKKTSGADIIFEGSNIQKLFKIFGQFEESDMESLFPDFSHYTKPDYVTLLTSKGCPYKCTYCASNKLQPTFRMLKAKKIIEGIKYMKHNYGVSHFAFYDDALLLNTHITSLLEEIIREDWRLNFHTPNGLHARFIDRTMAKLLKKSGFAELNLSLETTGSTIQVLTGNKVTALHIERAIENLYSAGFSGKQIRIYTIMGLPGQTFEEVEKTMNYVYTLGIENHLSVYSPVPGTEDFERIKKEYLYNLEDPLYHNGTYHYYRGKWFGFQERKDLLDRVHRLNSKIR